MEKIEKIIEEIDSLTVVELNDLVKAIEEKYGVSAVAAAAPAAGGAAGEAAAEKTSFDVVLASAGDQKIKVIKFDCQYNKDIDGKNILTAYSWYHIYDIIRKLNTR